MGTGKEGETCEMEVMPEGILDVLTQNSGTLMWSKKLAWFLQSGITDEEGHLSPAEFALHLDRNFQKHLNGKNI